MKQDSAVSTVVGTVLLLLIVVLVAGLCAAAVFSSIDSGSSDTPVVFFSASADEYALYHAGGCALSHEDIRIYSGDKDITDKTRIDGNRWTVWKTGDLLTFGKYPRRSVTIVYKNGEILY
ncbi:MAG TPA: type IV pilin [Methanocorpusculum sp.]|nr:type IV pilin [Methanocorpusculum sp.]